MSDQDLNPTIETPGVNEMLAGYLRAFLKAHPGEFGRQELRLTVDAVLAEDAASEEVIEVPAPMDMKVYVPIDVAKHGMPLDEIDLGDHQAEKAAHLRYRGIRTTTDLVEAHRDEIPANVPNQVEHALKLFITRFVPLVLVEFSEHHPSDASIHRQLSRLGCTTVWDLTQTTERKLSEYMNMIDIRWVKTTLKEKFGVGLKSPTPEKPPERKPGPGLGGPGGM